MALKLITSEEAAQVLGISLDELNHLREQREISGYRDGSNWKFKEQDVLRLKERRADDGGSESSEFDDFNFSVDAEESVDSDEFDFGAVSTEAVSKSENQDSQELIELPIDEDGMTDEVVLLSDLELGESGPGTSSTIIGRPGTQSPEESDIRILTDEDSADVSQNVGDASLPSDSGSSLALVVDDQFDVSSEADTQLRIGSQKPSSSGLDLGAGASDISLGDADLNIDDLVLGGDPSGSSGSGSGRGSKAGESGVALAVEDLDDDELVLGGGSDITLGSADSGISLASPSDSGLSLEEPLALRPKKEAPLAEDEMSLGLDAESEAGSDDDFLLTPMQDADEQDSGSQIIALDSESSIGADMFSDDAGMGGGMFEEAEEGGMLEGDFGAVASADPLAGAATSASLTAGPVSVPREAPYTMANVISLSACALILGMCGLLMFDLVRNMWSWDTPYTLNSSLADTILGIIPGMQ